MPASSETVNVLVSTYLEPELVERIAAADDRLRLLYEPDLLPEPRYRADHTGKPRKLDVSQQERWSKLLFEADIAFDFDWQAPAELPTRAPKLRWVQATSAGVGAFMTRTRLQDTDLIVTTAAGVHAVPLAEFAVTGALHFIKGFDELRRRQQAHHWERYTTSQLAGRTVTVVGLGGIGRRVVRYFDALDAAVHAVGRPGGSYKLPATVSTHSSDELDELLPRTDVLVLACPLTAETEGLISKSRIDALGPRAILINLARGQVVNEGALIDALVERRIAGACLDVFATEPLPGDSPLWDLGNVIVSPHSASTVDTENVAITDLFIDNIHRWLADRPLRNTYRRELGY